MPVVFIQGILSKSQMLHHESHDPVSHHAKLRLKDVAQAHIEGILKRCRCRLNGVCVGGEEGESGRGGFAKHAVRPLVHNCWETRSGNFNLILFGIKGKKQDG